MHLCLFGNLENLDCKCYVLIRIDLTVQYAPIFDVIGLKVGRDLYKRKRKKTKRRKCFLVFLVCLYIGNYLFLYSLELYFIPEAILISE